MKLRNYLNRLKTRTNVTIREFIELLDGVVLKDEISLTGGGGGTGPQGPEGPQGPPGTNGTNGEIGFPGFKYDIRRIGVNQYVVGEIIEYLGNYYICLANNDAIPPTGGAIGVYWNSYSFDSEGIPTGGTVGQILAKIDSTNYNTEWIDNYTSQVKHEVKAGVALTKGQAVYVTSANGTNMIVGKSSNATEATSSKTMGLIAQDLANNGIGYVITEGLLAGLDTSAASAGDPVWLGTNGGLLYGLANKPVAPANMVFIGIVTRVQSNNGEIFVKVQNGFELNELHDVAISAIANNDLLMYESATSLWKNKTLAQILTLVLGNGTSGQLLQTNGSGGFTWSSNAGKQGTFMDVNETSVTGTTAETINKLLLVPANTFDNSTAFKLKIRLRRTNEAFNVVIVRIYISSSASSTSGATLIGQSQISSSTFLASWIFQRSVTIVNKTTSSVFTLITANNSFSEETQAGPYNSVAIDWTTNKYILITTASSNATYTTYVRSIQVIAE